MVATAAAACTVWLLWNSSPPPAPYLCASCRFALCSLCKANPSSSHFFFQPPLPLLPPPRWFAAISKGGKIRTCFLLCQHSPTWTDAKSALAAFFFLFTHCPLHWRRQSRCSTTSDSDFFSSPSRSRMAAGRVLCFLPSCPPLSWTSHFFHFSFSGFLKTYWDAPLPVRCHAERPSLQAEPKADLVPLQPPPPRSPVPPWLTFTRHHWILLRIDLVVPQRGFHYMPCPIKEVNTTFPPPTPPCHTVSPTEAWKQRQGRNCSTRQLRQKAPLKGDKFACRLQQQQTDLCITRPCN